MGVQNVCVPPALKANVTSWLLPPRKEPRTRCKRLCGGKGIPPLCSQPSFCSCKRRKFASMKESAVFLLQRGPSPLPPPASTSPSLHSLGTGKFIFACGAEKPWTVSVCICVQMWLFMQLHSRNLWWLLFFWAYSLWGGSNKVLVHPWKRDWRSKRSFWVYSPSWGLGNHWNSISNHLF